MKKRCSSSRGPSQDENDEQDLGEMSFPLSQKATTKSTQCLLPSEYFKEISITSEKTIKNNLAHNGIAYDSKKEKGTCSSALKFRYKETTLESLNL